MGLQDEMLREKQKIRPNETYIEPSQITTTEVADGSPLDSRAAPFVCLLQKPLHGLRHVLRELQSAVLDHRVECTLVMGDRPDDVTMPVTDLMHEFHDFDEVV